MSSERWLRILFLHEQINKLPYEDREALVGELNKEREARKSQAKRPNRRLEDPEYKSKQAIYMAAYRAKKKLVQ